MNKKVIVLGVTGGISAYKSAQLARNLLKKGYEVHVMMTRNATKFVTPLTFEVLTNNKVVIDTFEHNSDYNVNHVSLAKKANLFVVVPATANVMAKFATGVADDMLTTTYLAVKCPTLIAPAMNTAMLEHVATQRNIKTLKNDGVYFIAPASGYLACGDVGAGRLADLADIEEDIEFLLQDKSFLKGKKVVITAGPTQEALDPVRFISNYSSGKMGYALARAARNLGADVHLITGPTTLKPPRHVHITKVMTAKEMYDASVEISDFDLFIAAAAVSDFKPAFVSDQKLKKNDTTDDLVFTFTQNADIVAAVTQKKKDHQVVCAFAMETQNLVENARVKLKKKQVDLVVANHLFDAGAGFKADTNKVTLISKDSQVALDVMGKETLAYKILTRLSEMI